MELVKNRLINLLREYMFNNIERNYYALRTID
jgi:hypothetical protein